MTEPTGVGNQNAPRVPKQCTVLAWTKNIVSCCTFFKFSIVSLFSVKVFTLRHGSNVELLCAKSNANEQNLLFLLISFRFGT